MKQIKTVTFYSAVEDKELFERVGFYRDDITALREEGLDVKVTNSLLDVLHFKSDLYIGYFYSKAVIGALLSRVLGSKTVLTGGADQISPTLLRGTKLFARRLVAALGVMCSNKILVSCKDDEKNFHQIAKWVFGTKKIRRSNHVITPSPFAKPSHKTNSEVNAFTLCWMGAEGNVRRKGVDRAVKLIYMLRKLGLDASLYIAGTGGEGESYLKSIISTLSMNDHVKIIGPITEDEKNQRFSTMGVYLQLSEYEGFGVAAAEAFFSGMTVVHTNKGGLADVIGHRGIIVNLNDIDNDCYEKILELRDRISNYYPDFNYLNSSICRYSHAARSKDFLDFTENSYER